MATHGGRRAGAGRPQGSGRYRGESTRVVRVPESLVDATIDQLREYSRVPRIRARRLSAETRSRGAREFTLKLPAGSPIVNDDRADEPCDLNELLVRDPESAFLYTISGDSMNQAGIFEGDRVIVDRGLQPASGDIVVAVLAGQGPTIKRLRMRSDAALLEPESGNPAHRTYALQPDVGDMIWGVVTGVVRRVGKSASRAKGTGARR